MNDAGLSTGWKIGALNSIMENLEIISIKPDAKSMKSLISNFCFCLIKFFSCSHEGLDVMNKIIWNGYSLFTTIMSYMQQIPWKRCHYYIYTLTDGKNISYHCSNSCFFAQHCNCNRCDTTTHTEPSV